MMDIRTPTRQRGGFVMGLMNDTMRFIVSLFGLTE